MLLWLSIDVSSLLYTLINCQLYIESFNSSATHILIPNSMCNDVNYHTFNFSRFTLIESIEIKNDCFKLVSTFQIDGLNRLKTLNVGSNSFTEKTPYYDIDDWKSFHILNCESLESIHIGGLSFDDFGGEFELKNLPQLQFIHIGNEAFHYSSFKIEVLIWYWISEWCIDLPNLQIIELDRWTFGDSCHTVIKSIEWIWMKWLM